MIWWLAGIACVGLTATFLGGLFLVSRWERNLQQARKEPDLQKRRRLALSAPGQVLWEALWGKQSPSFLNLPAPPDSLYRFEQEGLLQGGEWLLIVHRFDENVGQEIGVALYPLRTPKEIRPARVAGPKDIQFQAYSDHTRQMEENREPWKLLPTTGQVQLYGAPPPLAFVGSRQQDGTWRVCVAEPGLRLNSGDRLKIGFSDFELVRLPFLALFELSPTGDRRCVCKNIYANNCSISRGESKLTISQGQLQAIPPNCRLEPVIGPGPFEQQGRYLWPGDRILCGTRTWVVDYY